jgi:hypothetical protein
VCNRWLNQGQNHIAFITRSSGQARLCGSVLDLGIQLHLPENVTQPGLLAAHNKKAATFRESDAAGACWLLLIKLRLSEKATQPGLLAAPYQAASFGVSNMAGLVSCSYEAASIRGSNTAGLVGCSL